MTDLATFPTFTLIDHPPSEQIVTYTWSSPLDVVVSALEEALTPSEQVDGGRGRLCITDRN